MSFRNIIGHERPVQILKKALLRKNFAHAYLFYGEEGIGKKRVAKALAQAANCLDVGARAAAQEARSSDAPTPRARPGQASGSLSPIAQGESTGQQVGDSCGKCSACRHVEAETHPDVISIGPDGTMIKIDQIRTLQERMQLKPMSGLYRFVILDQAESMNEEAANALLKSLEEPPGQTVMFLITSQLHALLPTVVSRCQRVRFNPLTDQQVMGLLRQKHPKASSQLGRIAALAMGSVGVALEMDPEALEEEWLKLNHALLDKSQGSIQGLLDLSQEYAKDRETTERALHWIGLWLRDLLTAQVQPSSPYVIADSSSQQFMAAAAKVNVGEVMALAGLVHWIFRSLNRNINRQLALEVLLLQVRKAMNVKT
jgi:DNA polymerase-3 subunit delta'